MSFPTGDPFVLRVFLQRGSERKHLADVLLLPHPVVAPVALPAGQSAVAELQIEPVIVVDQSAAAEVADCPIDFAAGAAADVAERLSQRPRDIAHIHPKRQRRVVRQSRGEGSALNGSQLLRAGRRKMRKRSSDQPKRSVRKTTHDWTNLSLGAPCARPSRNGNTASINACGWSMLTAWPAAGITTFFASGIFAAMYSEAARNGVSSAPTTISDGTFISGKSSITRASRWVSMPRAARASPKASRCFTLERSGLSDLSTLRPSRSNRSAVSWARLFQASRASSFLKPGPVSMIRSARTRSGWAR